MSLTIVTRAAWGAKPARSRRTIDTPTPELYIHHTAGALDAGGNGVWWDDVRGIQDFHMRPVAKGGRGWSDVAYSFLVGGGQVFEGRGVGIAGGHTAGRNSVSHAICLIGSYDFMVPTPEDLRAIADLVRHGQQQGWWGDITGGHRDAKGASTQCPGKHLYDAIPEIRALAASTPPGDDDMTPEQAKQLHALELRSIAADERLERIEKRVGTDNDGADLSDELDLVRRDLRRIGAKLGVEGIES